ncbi:type IV secretory system conjugative DNA transfer family protein [Stratiformator vulcanicus]|uniref:AAA-like domain protein n=1 Tax=Stratiformator vulcanicus TaxID=2527980 RepID=A0A517R3G3_9PLAN|nr:type IV secretory system conjugative DNA transfer family protein [Stratiformator vulcanicus]QDT38397.1 AAA-like domain protein [Stratiformator vulcanicus]
MLSAHIPLRLGVDAESASERTVKPETLRTHLHMIGATGAGKTSAIMTLLRPLMLNPKPNQSCIFVIDPMGNLSRDLLKLIAHPRFSTEDLRRRLVYIEPAREDVVLPFNPLLHTSEANRYYQTMRAVDIVLRAWEAQSLAEQPRLFQWLYKSFCAAAMMGLPIATCRYLLHPGPPEHEAILSHIPGDIRYHWQEILKARGGEATRILESTRNRLDPFFESVNLRRMFGVMKSRFDCERFIRERRIVLLNLATLGRIPAFIAHTIGALALNELFETAARLTTTEGRHVVEPTYVVMDEFQNYVTPDIQEAIPTVRQMGLRMVLAHQSFSQLERNDIDLVQMIWQAQSRLMFKNSAVDADIVAEELAKWTFDPMTIKDRRTSVKQIITGYRREWFRNVSSTETTSDADMTQDSTSRGDSQSRTLNPNVIGYSNNTTGITSGTSGQSGQSQGRTSARSSGTSEGQSETNVPIHKTFRETSSLTFEGFDEFVVKWGQQIRKLKVGEAYYQEADTDEIRKIKLDHIDIPDSPEIAAAVERLKERNFDSDFFISAGEADREAEELRAKLLAGPQQNFRPDQATAADSEGESGSSDNSSMPFEL